MVNGANHMPIRRAGEPRSGPLSPNPSPPKPLTPARLESIFLSVIRVPEGIGVIYYLNSAFEPAISSSV